MGNAFPKIGSSMSGDIQVLNAIVDLAKGNNSAARWLEQITLKKSGKVFSLNTPSDIAKCFLCGLFKITDSDFIDDPDFKVNPTKIVRKVRDMDRIKHIDLLREYKILLWYLAGHIKDIYDTMDTPYKKSLISKVTKSIDRRLCSDLPI